jgi:polar amino acid transport system substrate-binding protein
MSSSAAAWRLMFGLFLVTAGAARGTPPLTIQPGTLTMCSAMNRPPAEFFNAAEQPAGFDIELGQALAGQLGLQPRFVNISFAGLIPGLLSAHCDIILSQLFIRPERLKVIDEIPYMVSQGGFLLRAGAPPAGKPEAFAGKTVVTVAGTTSADRLVEANTELAAENGKTIHIVQLPGNDSALQQLQYGQADAYAVAYETGIYYAHLRPDLFALGGKPYFRILAGIGVAKGQPGLAAALRSALFGVEKNGEYARIFTRWQLASDMLAP